MSRPAASDVATAMRALAEIEGRIPELAALPGATRTFLRFGRVLLAARFLGRLGSPRLAVGAWRRVRAVSRLGPLRTAFGAPFAERVAAPVKADLVIVKNGVRSIYADRPFTVKAADPRKPRASSRLRGEIAARRRVIATAEIDTPALLDAGETPTTAYLVEAFVHGTRHERRLGDPERFAVQLLRFHLANGARIRPVAEALDLEVEWRRFRDGATALGYRVPAGLAALVEQVARAGPGILFGLCHGDLSAENLLERPGQRCTILDWEYARDDPIFADVAKLAARNPSFARRFVAEADAWGRGQGGDVLDAHGQLALGGLVAVNRRADWIDEAADRAAAIRVFRRKATLFVQVIETALAQRRAAPGSSAPRARR